MRINPGWFEPLNMEVKMTNRKKIDGYVLHESNRKISTSMKTANKSVCDYSALKRYLDLHGNGAESTEDHGNSGQGSAAGCVERHGAGAGAGLAPGTSGRTIGRASGGTRGSVVRNEGSGGLGCGAGCVADGHGVIGCLSGTGGS